MLATHLRRYSAPIAAAALASAFHSSNFSRLEEKVKKDDDDERFYEYCPKSQMHQPKRPYPCWDNDWDLKEEEEDKSKDNGVTRHIILIRHGQYDETYEEDEKRKLTELGRKQAHLTGLRIAEMIRGGSSDANEKDLSLDKEGASLFKPCPVVVIRASGMTRAKETADIIGQSLPDNIIRAEPDHLLNEGIPAPIIPSLPDIDIEEDLAKDGKRVEEAFQKYFSRSKNDVVPSLSDGSTPNKQLSQKENKDEFEIIVCHGNIIRFFFCRALQLPPEAWLRMSTYNCSLTYLMIKPSGEVSCRMMGDIGHLGYEKSTFSMRHGFV